MWHIAPRDGTLALDVMAEKSFAGEPLPRWAWDSTIVCISKGEYQEDAARVLRRPAPLRLIALMYTISKAMARQADAALASIAASCVATRQRGFVAER